MKNFILVALAAVMLSFGWLELTGLVMLGGFVPMLVLASRYGRGRRDFWKMAGWTALFIVLWYGITVWWVWFATPVGPIAATFFALVYTGGAFMLWFWISKRAPRALSHTVFVSAWMAGEWIYNNNQASFPWLAVGNGFAHDTWAVQWYEWTGAYGGTLWVLICSVLIYEFLVVRKPRRWLPPALAVVVPVAVSLVMYFTYREPERTARVTIVQPNIPAWEEDTISDRAKAANLASLAALAPADARFIVMPETTIGEIVTEGSLAASPSLRTLRDTVARHSPEATVVVGAMTRRNYGNVPKPTHTAYADSQGWFDVYNAALAVAPDGGVDIHHKAKMVIGAEMMPTWWWVRGLQRMFAGAAFYGGHYGFGTSRTVFKNDSVPESFEAQNKSAVAVATAGAGICWESVYGEYFSEFVQGGAQVLFIITNDGWWRNTPGHRQHFDFARLRAIETRRAIARSANTGRSGFISSRGDVMRDPDGELRTLEWDERGAITADVPLSSSRTLFSRLGDWPSRVSMLVLGLSVLYFIAWRVRRRDYLVES